MEVGDDALCHHLADTFNLLQFLYSCIHQRIDILEVSRQKFGRCLADKSYSQCKHHALKWHILRCCDTVHYTLSRLCATTIAINLLHVDVVQIGYVVYQMVTIVFVDSLWTQRVDVHCFAGDKVLYAALNLWRTPSVVRTIPRCFALVAHQWRAAFWTTLDKLYRLGDYWALIDVYTNYLWYDFATFLYIHVVAYVQVETLDKILVVQCGALHCGTCQLHRIHICHRSDSTSSAHLISYLVQSGANTLGFEFVCDCPSWTLGCKTKCTLLADRVHFQHDTIRSHRQFFALSVPVVYEVVNLLQCLYLLHAFRYLKSPLASYFQVFKVSFGRQFFAQQII